MFLVWYCLLLFTFHSRTTVPVDHPLHVSVTEMNYEVGERTLEITVKIFTDDYETVLSQLYGKRCDFSSPQYQSAMSQMVKQYIPEHLKIYLDGKKVNYYYLGHEIIDMGVNNYFQAEDVTPFTKVRIDTDILYSLYEDQSSVCHFIVAGKRQSEKVTNPDRMIEFTFEKPNPFH